MKVLWKWIYSRASWWGGGGCTPQTPLLYVFGNPLFNFLDPPLERDCKATQPKLARWCSCTSKHGRFRTACNWRRSPVLAPWPGTCPDCNCVVFTLPAVATVLVYTSRSLVPGCTVAIVTLLAYSCKFLYCGVPGVVIVVQLLYLKCMHVLVETSIYAACYSHRGISTYVLLLW